MRKTILTGVTREVDAALCNGKPMSALSGEASTRDDVGYLRSERVRVTTDPPQKVAVDGEISGTTPIDVSCLPGALKIFMPLLEEAAPEEKLEGLPHLEIEPKE
jgi:diacylglycerol kinase family enzyme